MPFKKKLISNLYENFIFTIHCVAGGSDVGNFLGFCPRLFHLRFRCSLKNVVIL